MCTRTSLEQHAGGSFDTHCPCWRKGLAPWAYQRTDQMFDCFFTWYMVMIVNLIVLSKILLLLNDLYHNYIVPPQHTHMYTTSTSTHPYKVTS